MPSADIHVPAKGMQIPCLLELLAQPCHAPVRATISKCMMKTCVKQQVCDSEVIFAVIIGAPVNLYVANFMCNCKSAWQSMP